jgi:hypothetical protein
MSKIVVVVLLFHAALSAIPPWTPLPSPSTRFSSVKIPLKTSATFLSVTSKQYYPFLIFADDAPSLDLCSQPVNCSNDIYLDDIVAMLNSSNRTDAAISFNQCLYCDSDAERMDAFWETFRSNMQHICQFPVLYTEMWPNNVNITKDQLFQSEFASQLVMCYCGEGGGWRGRNALFGYRCDAFTRQWIPLAYRYTPFILALLLGLLFIFDFSVLYVPRMVERIKSVTKCSDLIFKVFDLRVQSLTLLLLSISCLICEQMIIILNTTYSHDFQHFWTSGFARKLSLMFLGTCYATTLIQWVHILVDKQTEHSAKISGRLKLMLWMVYFIMITLLVTTLFLNYSAHVSLWISHLIFASVAALYLIVFPLGFTVAGIKLFLTLRKYGTKVTKLKFIWFMISTDIIFTIGFVDGILIIITYIFGWDYFGFLFGMFDTMILDCVSLVVYFLLIYILFNGSLLCKIQKRQQLDEETKRLVEETEGENMYPTIPTRRHSFTN